MAFYNMCRCAVKQLRTHSLFACCQESGPLCERGMVLNVLDHSFDVMIVKLGVIKRVYCEVCCRYYYYYYYYFSPGSIDPGG